MSECFKYWHVRSLYELEVTDAIDHVPGCELEFVINICCFPNTGSWRKPSLTERRVRLACGVHPVAVNEGYNLDELKDMVKSDLCVGIGECGYDISSLDKTDKDIDPDAQFNVFEEQVKLAVNNGKTLMIHCRPAVNMLAGFCHLYRDAFSLIKSECPESQHIVWHCYLGSVDLMEELSEGYPNTYFGVHPISLDFVKYPWMRETIPKIPWDKLLLETDSPYCVIQPDRNKCAPTMLPVFAIQVAPLLCIPSKVLLYVASQNAKQAFHMDE